MRHETHVVAIAGCLSACVSHVDLTRVALHDPSELAVQGSGEVPRATSTSAPGLADHDLLIIGSAAEVLAFDGDTLHVHVTRDGVHRRPLDLRVDTPLANVRSIEAIDMVANRAVIPLGWLAGGLMVAFGGGAIAYDLAEHEHVAWTGPTPVALGFGLVLLAIELHGRLAHDTTTTVWPAPVGQAR